ncbi:NAD(P)-dependent oxidoreductase [Empedobacter falsenii]
MKILITGASGFLGRNLVQELLKENHELIVVGRSFDKLNDEFNKEEITLFETDYSVENLKLILQDVDSVIHLASQLMQRDTNPYQISQFNQNIQLTENLLIAADECSVKQFINTSSISVYPLKTNLSENEFLAPSNIYGVSKANIESYLAYFQTKTKMNIISLRLARLYGYGERNGLMFTDFIHKAINNETLTLHGTGSSTIEYIYIKDAISAYTKIIQSQKIRGAYNIGTGKRYSIKEIAETIVEIYENGIVYLKDKPDGIQGSEMNVDLAYNEFNWKANWNLKSSILDIKKSIENEQR